MAIISTNKHYALDEVKDPEGGIFYTLYALEFDDDGNEIVGAEKLTAWTVGMEMPDRFLAQMVRAYEERRR